MSRGAVGRGDREGPSAPQDCERGLHETLRWALCCLNSFPGTRVPPEPENVALFGDRVIADVIRLRPGGLRWALISNRPPVRSRR